jgi:hypothetical protein
MSWQENPHIQIGICNRYCRPRLVTADIDTLSGITAIGGRVELSRYVGGRHGDGLEGDDG